MSERRQRRAKRTVGAFQQQPFRQVVNPYDPIRVISDDQVEAIHQASLKVLQEIGMDFLWPEARATLKAAGADVAADGERVRFDPAFIEEKIATCPPEVTLHARNPAHTVRIGGRNTAFCLMGSAPNATDIDRGRRTGNFEDYKKLIQLGQSLNVCHIVGGYPVEPVDLHPAVRHLDALHAQLTLCDKFGHAYSLGPDRIADGMTLYRIAHGLTPDAMRKKTVLCTIINTNSPLKLDVPMLIGMTEMARQNQLVVVTPFTLSGAMAPATIAGALVQQNAEALATIAYCQIVNPGAPVAYGGFTSNVDMKSGAPAFGTPEYAKAALAGGQLARRYNIPYRSSNVNAANCVDGQAAWESVMSLWGALMGGCHFLKHGLGWLEGGLSVSFEKVMMDAELLQMMASFFEPISTAEDELGLEAIADVGPGGHFFGTAHTIARYENAFYPPILADWRNFENWRDAGSHSVTERANVLWKKVLAEAETPPMDPGIREELDDFVARRKAEGGAREAA